MAAYLKRRRKPSETAIPIGVNQSRLQTQRWSSHFYGGQGDADKNWHYGINYCHRSDLNSHKYTFIDLFKRQVYTDRAHLQNWTKKEKSSEE